MFHRKISLAHGVYTARVGLCRNSCIEFSLTKKTVYAQPLGGSPNTEIRSIQNECSDLVLTAFPIRPIENLASSSLSPRCVFCELLTTNERIRSYCSIANLSLN